MELTEVPSIFTPCFFQFSRNIERCLSAELNDNAQRFFFLINAQDIFDSQRFEIEFVRGIIISGNCFRIAVDHDGLITHVPQGKSGMNAAIIKFNTLADTVRSTPSTITFGRLLTTVLSGAL